MSYRWYSYQIENIVKCNVSFNAKLGHFLAVDEKLICIISSALSFFPILYEVKHRSIASMELYLF